MWNAEWRSSVFMAMILLAMFYSMYLLSSMLTPFFLGVLFAYWLVPAVAALDRLGLPHVLSVALVFISMALMVCLLMLLLLPMIQQQWQLFSDTLPIVIEWLRSSLIPWLKAHEMIDIESVKSGVTSALPKTGWLLSQVIRSGQFFITFGVTIALTPVVTFYMLRDWERILANVVSVFPSHWQPVVKRLSSESDRVLSDFFRGQLMVMIALSVIYGVGLFLAGLHVGLFLGIVGGMLSVVPYLGSLVVLLLGSLLMWVQGGEWHSLVWVWLVYGTGQVLEGYVLTPYFVGDRIGLHPLMVIFSVMAGGTLFGFLGVIVALPLAAVLKVWLRYLQEAYLMTE